VYVASSVTFATSGDHPANVYVYCVVAALVGSAGAVGVSPYTTSLDCNSVPSSSTNVIVYLFTVELN
jgi:hypothetical protein